MLADLSSDHMCTHFDAALLDAPRCDMLKVMYIRWAATSLDCEAVSTLAHRLVSYPCPTEELYLACLKFGRLTQSEQWVKRLHELSVQAIGTSAPLWQAYIQFATSRCDLSTAATLRGRANKACPGFDGSQQDCD